MFESKTPEATKQYAANVDVNSTRDNEIEGAIEFLIKRLQSIQEVSRINFMLVMDGDRSAIVEALKDGKSIDSRVGNLSTLLREKAKSFDIALLDLTQAFSNDYKINKNIFRFRHDGHWNQHAHEVVARALARELLFVRKLL